MVPDPLVPPDPPPLAAGRRLARKEQLMNAIEGQHRPAAARVPHRRRLAAAVAVLTVAVAATVIATNVAGSTPAYAVSRNPDGSVEFVIHDIRDAAGATRALQAAGVPAVVLPEHKAGSCRPGNRGTPDDVRMSAVTSIIVTRTSQRSAAGLPPVVIRPSNIPSGDILVLGIPPRPAAGSPIMFGSWLYRSPGPNCVEQPPPPGQ